MLARGRDDIEAVLSRDAAAQSPLEVALLYPGVHAVWAHRLSHALWERGARRSARAVSQVARFATGSRSTRARHWVRGCSSTTAWAW